MAFLDKLKDFINVDLRGLNINLFNFHIENNNASDNRINIDQSKKNIHINLAKISDIEKEKLSSIISDSFEEGEILILDENSDNVINEFIEAEKNSETQSILNFFKGKIPNQDYFALRMSLYVKKRFQDKKEIDVMKNSIVEKYGARGRTICNLCTSGYFTDYIKPLYETMSSQEGFELEKFNNVYELIIRESGFSLFIKFNMYESDIKNELLRKIEANKSYGIYTVTVHGIGKTKIRKIQQVLDELEDQGLLRSIEIQKEGGVLSAKCNIPRNSPVL